jgi:hypothetical protein
MLNTASEWMLLVYMDAKHLIRYLEQFLTLTKGYLMLL